MCTNYGRVKYEYVNTKSCDNWYGLANNSLSDKRYKNVTIQLTFTVAVVHHDGDFFVWSIDFVWCNLLYNWMAGAPCWVETSSQKRWLTHIDCVCWDECFMCTGPSSLHLRQINKCSSWISVRQMIARSGFWLILVNGYSNVLRLSVVLVRHYQQWCVFHTQTTHKLTTDIFGCDI